MKFRFWPATTKCVIRELKQISPGAGIAELIELSALNHRLQTSERGALSECAARESTLSGGTTTH
ncbi:MAG: hypothetical protein KF752_03970 [Pirellulaceae bacterium]|nr:hypothetical protein [Pirellulaceae bacterium]